MRVRVQKEGGCNLGDPHWPAGSGEGKKGTEQCTSVRTKKLGGGWTPTGLSRVQGGSCLILEPPKRLSHPFSLVRLLASYQQRTRCSPGRAVGLLDSSHGGTALVL